MSCLPAYVFSTIGGWIVLMALVPLMHRTSGIKGTLANQMGDKRPFFQAVGSPGRLTERAIATFAGLMADPGAVADLGKIGD